jgi:hypothetical protein
MVGIIIRYEVQDELTQDDERAADDEGSKCPR